MKRYLTLLFFFASAFTAIYAQDNCEVTVENLQGTYTGECSGGKANGKGVAIGKDKYEGDFVKGYPEGTGTYRWKDSSYYTGSWKKGKREGKGEMHYKIKYQPDSVLTGFWKKDKYAGAYEVQYKIHGYSSRINRVSCSLQRLQGKNISIKSTQLTNSSGPITGAVVLPELDNIVVLQGAFLMKNIQSLQNSQIYTLKNIDFPFKAIFYYKNGEQFEISFFEQADYSVDVLLQ